MGSTRTGAEALRNTICFGAITLLATALLLFRLDSQGFWIDEIHSYTLAGASLESIPPSVAGDLHPPLYFLLLNLWSLLVGRSEFALRFFSVAAGLLSLALVYALARRLWNERLGLVAVFLVTVSPFFLLYSRMTRYYSLTLLLALLSVVVFLRLLARSSWLLWAAFALVGAALIYTDYPVASVMVTENLVVLWLFWQSKRPKARQNSQPFAPGASKPDARDSQSGFILAAIGPGFFPRWAIAQIAILALYLPWLGTVLRRVALGNPAQSADFARDLVGYIPKLAFPFYSFSVGETLFPWHPVAPLVLVVFAVLGGFGIWLLVRDRPDSAIVLLAFLVIPLLFTTFVVTYITTATTFLNIPSRTMFAFPFFILIVSAGVLYKRDARIQGLALMVIVLGSALSLANYHRGLQVFNPIYVVPVREVVQGLSEQARPGDVFIGEHDIGFAQYYHPSAGSPPYFRADSEEAVRYLVKEKSPRVWLVTFGRDSTRVGANTLPPLQSLLASDYHLESSKGYVEQDPTYRRFKELLLRRPAYRYKLLVEMYVRN